MKKVLKVLGVLAIIGALAAVAGLYFTSGLGKSADEFFSKVKAKDYAGAYQLTSKEFQASTSQDQLIKFLNKSELANYVKGSWSSRKVSGSQGELEGSIETTGGGVVPIKITFVKEQDAWKILAINKAASGLVSEPPKTTGTLPVSEPPRATGIPPEKEMKQMVNATMLDFALAVNSRDFSNFYKNISQLWQSQITTEKLQELFKPFSDQNIDLTILRGMEPEFDEKPALTNDDQVLVLKGK